MMKPTEEDRCPSGDDSGIDAALRRALEPEAVTVDRLVRGALAERETPPAFRHWRLAAATAAMVLLALVALPILLSTTPERPASDAPPQSATVLPPAATIPASSSEPAPLRISNEGGPVTVTTTAGSKMIFLPLFFEQNSPGDAS